MYDIRRRATLILAVAAAVAACLAVVPGASATAAPARPAGSAERLASGNPWGQAREVPGTAALNKGGYAGIASVSCASAGDCSAGGYYAAGQSGYGFPLVRAFVVSEVNGRWRKAEEVPGLAAFGGSSITSVSCASAGNCSAVGDGGSSGAFVVSEVRGRWRKAEAVRGLAAIGGTGGIGGSSITSVSCASAGNCSAGGSYWTWNFAGAQQIEQALVVSEVRGRWRKAEEVPGIAALNKAEAETTSVSCASAGNCSAGGYYAIRFYPNGVDVDRAFVVSEVHGRWRKAGVVAGTTAVVAVSPAGIASVSCGSAGNCSAGGYYQDATQNTRAFVVSEVHGRWRKAEEVPGLAAFSQRGNAEFGSVSCASAGNCSAGGSYGGEAFVVSEVHGTWRKAEVVPGTAALNKGGAAWITSVSCASAGNCSAGGHYNDVHNAAQVFVVSEVHGRWRKAEEVPGTAKLNKGGGARITSVSCAPAGHCSAGGYYPIPGTDQGEDAFVVSRK